MATEIVLVTGGLGFIGSHLVDMLVNLTKYKIVVVDNLLSGNRKFYVDKPNVRYEYVEFDNEQTLREIKNKKYLAVFHLAAQASVPFSIEEPFYTLQENLVKTFNLIEACAVSGTKFIFSSSSAIYGNAKKLPILTNTPVEPTSPYAAQKAAVELFCKSYSNTHGLLFASLRYFNVYGPRQNPYGAYPNVVSSWLKAACSNEPIKIFGTGEQRRDFIFVKEAARANLRALEYLNQKKKSLIDNVASGKNYSLLEVLAEIKKEFPDLVVEYHEPRKGDVSVTLGKKSDLINNTTLETGLKQTISWCKDWYKQ